MSAWTKGPWVHYPEDNIIVGKDGRMILEWQARSLSVSVPERDANAHLIAAAPELAEALERALNWLASYQGEGTMGPDGPYEQARAALRKARGE